jgi:hypothetical protein
MYAGCEIKPEEFNKLIDIQFKTGRFVKEQTIGSRKNLYLDNKIVATTTHTSNLPIGNITKQQFASFLGAFSRNLYNQLKDNDQLMILSLRFDTITRGSNQKLYKTLENGEIFYNIDLSSAYWQVAHKLGYISDSLFEKYINQDEFKEAKRYCISFLARPNKMSYSQADGSKFTIHCDTGVLQNVYSNIRNALYKNIHKAKIGLNVLEFNIDGITVTKEDAPIVKERLTKMGFIFKSTLCLKMSDGQYKCGKKVKTFK